MIQINIAIMEITMDFLTFSNYTWCLICTATVRFTDSHWKTILACAYLMNAKSCPLWKGPLKVDLWYSTLVSVIAGLYPFVFISCPCQEMSRGDIRGHTVALNMEAWTTDFPNYTTDLVGQLLARRSAFPIF